jgi:mannose-1-phosphate guanylyltransferase
MSDAFMSAAPDIGVLIEKVVKARFVTSILKKEYPTVRSISFDYAVMEKINNILVVKSDFTWDDVGSWIAIENHFPKDTFGNVCLGKTKLYDVANSIVVGSDNHITALVGVKDIVVVHTDGATLVCAKNSVQDVKKLLR